MTTTTNFREWLVQRFGSMDAVDERFDEFSPEGARMYREWQLAVCEEAGIPYAGWTADSLRCARLRMETSESEITTVRTLNGLHNSAPMTALDHWIHHLAGAPSAYA
jgi:hypothetical protein